jgi:hypothetical protein
MKFAGDSGCGEVLWLLSYGRKDIIILRTKCCVVCVKNRV